MEPFLITWNVPNLGFKITILSKMNISIWCV